MSALLFTTSTVYLWLMARGTRAKIEPIALPADLNKVYCETA
jgi:hypothetical protein